MSSIPNVLAERYASSAITDIWSASGRIVLEREFWIAVMKAQRALGLDIPQEAIEAYESVKDQVAQDYKNDLRITNNKEAFQKLKELYTIEIE